MRTSMTAAALLFAVAAGPAALAQEGQDLSEDQVRSFLKDASQQAEKSVDAGDWQGFQDWAQNNLADDAQFALKGAILSAEGGTFTYAGSLSAPQFERLSSSGMAMGPRGLVQAVEDYALKVDIQSVNILPNGEATALVLFQESGRLDPAQLAKANGAGGEAREGRSATAAPDDPAGTQEEAVFEATSRCNLRLSGAGGSDKVQISLAACDTTVTF